MGSAAPHSIYRKIAEGTVTADDFNELLTETSVKSAKERVRRAVQPIDANRMHDSDGHSRVGDKNLHSRSIQRKGGGSMNDPRKTGRGRAMLRKQERTKSEEVDSSAEKPKKEQALDLVHKHATPDDLYGLWWNEYQGRLRVSNGDWAEYDRSALKAELDELLGADNVEMDDELGNPSGDDWEKLQRTILDESSAYPVADFQSKPIYDPICPHCDEVLGERSYVPDRDGLATRMEAISRLTSEQRLDLIHGRASDGDLGLESSPCLFRHRGPCYDKGPFLIRWPSERITSRVKSNGGES